MEIAGLLDRERTALVVIDMQEAFRSVVEGFDAIAGRTVILIRGARAIGLPVVVTEQYPHGLGSTVPELAEHLKGIQPVEKTVFSAVGAEGFDLAGRDQAVLCGIEAHICVSQTAHELLEDGIEVHVARDAIGARDPADRELGLRKMERAGAVETGVEAALFELLRESGTPEFRQVQELVK